MFQSGDDAVVSLFRIVRKKDMDRISHLSFRYTAGTALNARVCYELTEKNGRCHIFVLPKGHSENEVLAIDVPNSFAESVRQILLQYHTGRWNGFDKKCRRVLDGRSFTLNVRFHSGKEIHAHGYMRRPKHFREVRAALDDRFMSVYHQNEQTKKTDGRNHDEISRSPAGKSRPES